jgi:hypothetical protein
MAAGLAWHWDVGEVNATYTTISQQPVKVSKGLFLVNSGKKEREWW